MTSAAVRDDVAASSWSRSIVYKFSVISWDASVLNVQQFSFVFLETKVLFNDASKKL